MKKIICATIIFIFVFTCFLYVFEYLKYDIREIGVKIDLPINCEVSNKKNDTVYLTALTKDNAKIEISFDNNSELVNAISSLEYLNDTKTEIYINRVKQLSDENGIEIKKYKTLVHDEHPFVEVWYHDTKTSEHGIQYATVYNFSLYTITLKLHTTETLTPEHEKLINTIVESFDIYDTPSSPNFLRQAEYGAWNSYNLDEIGMNICIPPEYFVIRNDVPENHPLLKQSNTSQEELFEHFKENDIYLSAMPENMEFEVYISTEPADTIASSASRLDEFDLKKFIKEIKKTYAGMDLPVSEASVLNVSGEPFINIYMPERQYIQNITIHNSQLIAISFRASDTLTDRHRNVFDNITRSITFNTTEEMQSSIIIITAFQWIFAALLPITFIVLIFLLILFFFKKKIQKNLSNKTHVASK